MEYIFKPKGVCARQMEIKVEEDKITSVMVVGGCAGNSLGVASLLKGMLVDDAIDRLKGIKCGVRATSCPDQIAVALTEMKQKKKGVTV